MKKVFHKLIPAVLIAALVLTLSGCGSDETLKKAIAGTWICKDIDMTDSILEEMRASAGDAPETEELFRHLDVGTLAIDYLLELHEDGTFLMTVDQSSADKLIEQFSSSISDALSAYLEDTLKMLAEESDMTLDDLMSALGCSSMDEVIKIAMGGQTMDEYVDQLLPKADMQSIFEEGTSSGTYSVKSGKILLSSSDSAVSLIEYDEKSDTLSLTESGFDEPFLFVRH